MAGRSASASITRYAGIQVQTSALGLNVPVGWGTFRCKCNLVDYLDFKSKSKTAAAAKGGTTTGYSYSATVILALCEGPIDSVSTIYVDGKVYKNGAKTALSQANLNLHTGAIGQSVWGYLTSNHPAHAIGYSGLAIAYQSNYALDSSAQTPNHSFEVVRTAAYGVAGTPDADPSLVVSDFFTNTRYGVPSWAPGLLGDLTPYQDYCLAAGLLVSPVIDSQRSASDFLTELLRATNSTCVWSEGVLKFIPYGDTPLTGNGKTYTPNITPAYALGDDDYIPQSDGDDPLTIDIQDQSDAYNVVQLEYLDRTNEYNMAIALASDAANVAQYGLRRKDPDTVHCIAAPTVAALSAQLYLQRTLYIRSQFKFTLGWQFALLEPGDILELTDTGLGLGACPVRIIQIDDDEDACRSITAEDFPVGVHNAPLYTMQTGQAASRDTNIDPGGVEANLLLWSDDPTQTTAWGWSACTVTGAAGNDQYGLSTAAWIVPTGVSSWHGLYQAFAAFPGEAYTYSVCLQQGAHRYALVQISDFVASAVYVNIDLQTGQLTGSGAFGPLATLVGCSVTPTLVGGVWQVVVTGQNASATTLYAVCAVLDPTQAFTWVGDGSNAILASQHAVRQGVDPGVYAATAGVHAQPLLFNPPSVLSAGGSQIFAAVAGGPNWGGCNVWLSLDGANYAEVGTIDAPARYGRLTAALASHADPDTADTLSVDLGWSGGALTGASQTSVDNGATNSWIEGELVGFESATLTNPSRYNLGTYLRRGYLNSPIAAHAPGDYFVRLDEAIFDFPYLAVNVGQTIYVKFQSFNLYGQALQDLSACIAYPCIPSPTAAVAPLASQWSCVGGAVTNAGVSIPAVFVSGACENPSATGVHVYERPHGAAAWISYGRFPPATTNVQITGLPAGQGIDVGVSFVVNDVETPITPIGANVVAGASVAGAVVGQAPAATDPTIASGATKNQVTYSPTAPTGATDGDIWIDTAGSTAIVNIHIGAWLPLGTYNQFFYQPDDPAGHQYVSGVYTAGTYTVPDGAIWINATTGVEKKRFGGAWVGSGSSMTWHDGDTLYVGYGTGAYTIPAAYNLTHVDIVITGGDGGNFWHHLAGSPPIVLFSGGAGETRTYAGLAVAAGSTTIDFALGAAGNDGPTAITGTNVSDGAASSVTSPIAMTANPGHQASNTANGAGGSGGSGGTSNTPGASGGSAGSPGKITLIART